MINQIGQIDLQILLTLNSLAVLLPVFVNKLFTEYLVYLMPIIFIIMFFFFGIKEKKAVMRAFLSAMVAWPLVANTLGQIINRPRPFSNGGIQELIFHRPTYSFPSDHAAALFAVSISFWLSGYKKLGIFFFVGSIAICVFRVATAIHWPTDIFAGAGIGLLFGWLIWLADQYLDKIYNIVLTLLKKAKLA